jgi:hypothetical protein
LKKRFHRRRYREPGIYPQLALKTANAFAIGSIASPTAALITSKRGGDGRNRVNVDGHLNETFYARLKSSGFLPEIVYDIGAAGGSWAFKIARLFFPQARYELFEPLADVVPPYTNKLAALKETPYKFILHPFALGEKTGTANMAVTSEPTGSTSLDVGLAAHSIIFPACI